mgnify:CR=1 FL=1
MLEQLIHLSIDEAIEVMDSIQICIEEIEEEKKEDSKKDFLVSAYYSIQNQLKNLELSKAQVFKWFSNPKLN